MVTQSRSLCDNIKAAFGATFVNMILLCVLLELMCHYNGKGNNNIPVLCVDP